MMRRQLSCLGRHHPESAHSSHRCHKRVQQPWWAQARAHLPRALSRQDYRLQCQQLPRRGLCLSRGRGLLLGHGRVHALVRTHVLALALARAPILLLQRQL